MNLLVATLISLFHHLFTAIWVGGIIVYFSVVALAIKDSDFDTSKLFSDKFKENLTFVMFLAITLVLGTGIMFEDGISFLLGEGIYAHVLGLKVLAMVVLLILIIPSLAVEKVWMKFLFGLLHSIAAIYIIYLSLELKYIRYNIVYPWTTYFWAIIHDLFSYIWLGGMIAYSFIILTTARSTITKASQRKILMLVVRKNMAILAFVSMFMLTLSGLFLFPPGNIWQYFFSAEIRYSSIFYRKLVTSIILALFALIKIFKIDYIKVPKRKRKWILTITYANITLVTLILFLSVLMRYVRYTLQ